MRIRDTYQIRVDCKKLKPLKSEGLNMDEANETRRRQVEQKLLKEFFNDRLR